MVARRTNRSLHPRICSAPRPAGPGLQSGCAPRLGTVGRRTIQRASGDAPSEPAWRKPLWRNPVVDADQRSRWSAMEGLVADGTRRRPFPRDVRPRGPARTDTRARRRLVASTVVTAATGHQVSGIVRSKSVGEYPEADGRPRDLARGLVKTVSDLSPEFT
jgi:hypothetical protein